jgi:teichuronic acid biosynthesis protein TuaE
MQSRVVKTDDISRAGNVLWYAVLVFAFIGGNITIGRLGDFHVLPYRVLLFVYWFVFVIRFILSGGKLSLPTAGLEIRIYLLFFVVWFLYAILSIFWVESKIDWFRHCFFLFSGFSIIFFSLYNFNSEHKLKQLYFFWIVMIIILVGFGIWENLTGNHLPESNVYSKYDFNVPMKVRIPSGIYTNPNDYATFLCVTAPISYSLFKYSREILLKISGAVLVLSAVYLIFFTSSRANMIALVLEALAILFLLVKKRQFKYLKKVVILLIICALVFVFIYSSSDNYLSTRFGKLKGEISNLATGDASIESRRNLIKNGLIFLRNNWFLGVGAGNNEWYQGNRGVYDTLGKTSMHNWWMEILVDYGIFIFIFYIMFYFILLRRLYEATWSETRIISIFSESIFLGLIGFSIASISSSSIFSNRTIWFFFATAVIVVNMYKREKVRE